MNHAEQFAERCYASLTGIVLNGPLWEAQREETIKILAGSYQAFQAALQQHGRTKQVAFAPPGEQEVAEYFREIGCNADAGEFNDFYAQKGWKVGTQPMKDWKATARRWKRNAWGQLGDTVPRNQQASLGALQIELETVRTQIKAIVNPGGAAWPKTASQLAPGELDRVRMLEARLDSLKQRIACF